MLSIATTRPNVQSVSSWGRVLKTRILYAETFKGEARKNLGVDYSDNTTDLGFFATSRLYFRDGLAGLESVSYKVDEIVTTSSEEYEMVPSTVFGRLCAATQSQNIEAFLGITWLLAPLFVHFFTDSPFFGDGFFWKTGVLGATVHLPVLILAFCQIFKLYESDDRAYSSYKTTVWMKEQEEKTKRMLAPLLSGLDETCSLMTKTKEALSEKLDFANKIWLKLGVKKENLELLRIESGMKGLEDITRVFWYRVIDIYYKNKDRNVRIFQKELNDLIEGVSEVEDILRERKDELEGIDVGDQLFTREWCEEKAGITEEDIGAVLGKGRKARNLLWKEVDAIIRYKDGDLTHGEIGRFLTQEHWKRLGVTREELKLLGLDKTVLWNLQTEDLERRYKAQLALLGDRKLETQRETKIAYLKMRNRLEKYKHTWNDFLNRLSSSRREK
ncbi:MAG: hypothetical protein HQ564_09960 [Candidatus Saganbacteria bacterium]|nr:hypothetical protein [Candidatus Saganbacteria bacterium]